MKKIILICFVFTSIFCCLNYAQTPNQNAFNLKLTIKYYNNETHTDELYRDGFLYVITTQKIGGYSPSHYIKTNVMGRADLALPYNSSENIITIYKVDTSSSSIRLNCKLAQVNGEKINYLTIPYSKGKTELTYDLVMGGQC